MQPPPTETTDATQAQAGYDAQADVVDRLEVLGMSTRLRDMLLGQDLPNAPSVFCHSDAHIQRLDVRECFRRGLHPRNGRRKPHSFMHWMCASKIPKFCNFWDQTSVGANGVQAFHSKF